MSRKGPQIHRGGAEGAEQKSFDQENIPISVNSAVSAVNTLYSKSRRAKICNEPVKCERQKGRP
jgi:hypothetical protein